MTLLVAFLLLALLFGVGGAVRGVAWFFFVALVLALVGIFFGARDY